MSQILNVKSPVCWRLMTMVSKPSRAAVCAVGIGKHIGQEMIHINDIISVKKTRHKSNKETTSKLPQLLNSVYVL